MTRVGLWLTAGGAGAATFWMVQVVSGGPTITHFIGEQITEVGGYPPGVAPAIGWAVHLGVSFCYALGHAVIVLALARAGFAAQVGLGLAVAVGLGWVTAIVAPPAISVTISLLGGRGWPSDLFPLNTEIGLPFWNHVGFFLLSWLVQGLGPHLVRIRPVRDAAVGA